MGNAQQRSSSQNRLQSVKSMSALLDMSKGSPHRSPLAALLQAAKLERHPRLAQRALRVAKLSLIAHNVKVHAADLVAQAVEPVMSAMPALFTRLAAPVMLPAVL